VNAALDSRRPRRRDLLLVHCAASEPRRPVLERLREKLGAELTRVLVFALTQRRSARRG
jgi:hypothetical protein